MLGLEKGHVILNEHDKNWKKYAEETKKILKKILGLTAVDIQHVGSTSIKYIKAKPIIDIMIALNNFDDLNKYESILKDKGYFKIDISTINSTSATNDINEILYLSGDLEKNIITYHIHFVIYKSEEYFNYINFRDYLIVNNMRRREYENLKIKLALTYPDKITMYTEGKVSFILNILDEAKSWRILGKIVTVTIDIPSGTNHPQNPDIIYPINYGYIKGIAVKDNNFQNAFVISTKKPMNGFTGIIVAIIKRKNELIDKLVVGPVGKKFYKPQIIELLHFQDQFFDDEYICLYEKSCGAVVYTQKNNQILYLLIKNRSKNIGFPKGHVENGETEQKTALREIKEETGLTVELDKKFKEFYGYTVNFFMKKQVVYFLAKFNSNIITIPEEEILSYHLVPFKEALHLLNYENERKILRNANNYLKNKK